MTALGRSGGAEISAVAAGMDTQDGLDGDREGSSLLLEHHPSIPGIWDENIPSVRNWDGENSLCPILPFSCFSMG